MQRHKPANGTLGAWDNPIPVDAEDVDMSKLPWGDYSCLYVRRPSGNITKCYYSYADYCDD